MRLASWLGTPVVGFVGGYIAALVNWPLPWVVGSLVAVMLTRCAGWMVTDIPYGRRAGQWLVATGLGLYFTRDVLSLLAGHALVIVVCGMTTLVLSLLGMSIFRRGGNDPVTSYFASMPGGASEMISLAVRHGAGSPERVAAAQSLRIMLVVLVIPPLFSFGGGAALERLSLPVDWNYLVLLLLSGIGMGALLDRMNMPIPWMLGPLLVCCLLTASLDLHMGLPPGLGELGQWLIGCSIGCYFDRTFFRSAPAFLLQVVIFTLLTMGGAMAVAWIVTRLTELSVVSVILGMMPGGITELSLTAQALNESVALVIAIQIVRFLIVVLFADVLFRTCFKSASRSPEKPVR